MCNHHRIREAAAALLFDAHAMLRSAERDTSPGATGKGKKGSKGGKSPGKGKGDDGAEQQLLCAAQILLPYVDNEISCAQVVEALWDALPALQVPSLHMQMSWSSCSAPCLWVSWSCCRVKSLPSSPHRS